MSFLAPLFFAALAALAIPVLIHLIQREKKQVVRFPSLMFVQRVPYKSVRRRRIHNWLLLCVRLTALALIVLAFARPFLRRDTLNTAVGAGAREVVVLLDDSYSLAYGDHWERARAAASNAINGLGPDDRGSLVLFGSGAEIALRSAASGDRPRLAAAVAAARPGASATRYAPALKVAGSILAESSLPRREVVLISDFQRGGWRGEEGARLPEGTTVTPVAIAGGADAPNVAVTGVSLARSTFSNQERVAVTAVAVNRGTRALRGGQLSLEIGGRPIQSKPLDVEVNGSVSVVFDPVTVAGAFMRGSVRASDDALAVDNAFHFVVSPAQPVRVIVVDRGATGGGALYLTRALAIGEAPRFETVVRQPDAVAEDDLRRASVVLLNDVAVPAALARRLQRFVEGGGGLLVALGPRASWSPDVDVLPAAIEAPVDRTRGDAARLGTLEFGHPGFEPFRAPRSGDFAAARIYGYRAVKPAADAQVLARFDGGAPALVERRVGAGKVLLWASSLDLSWSDFPLKPVYLPFVHRAARHLASYSEPAPWLTVGQVLDASAGAARSQPASGVVLTPSGRRVSMDEEGAEVIELAEQGFYELRNRSGDAVTAVVASNVDTAESDLTPMDPKEIVAAATAGPGGGREAGGSGQPVTPETQERSQRLWWYVLCLGILLLGADTVISNRLSKS
ncbi:MAG: BatA domain-containing protein [Acidobacteria bacterium]|nr:BatA domain-containing protein [Acidobacteriota bacterium]